MGVEPHLVQTQFWKKQLNSAHIRPCISPVLYQMGVESFVSLVFLLLKFSNLNPTLEVYRGLYQAVDFEVIV